MVRVISVWDELVAYAAVGFPGNLVEYGEDLIPAVRVALLDPDPSVRRIAALAAAHMYGDGSSLVSPLIEALEHEHEREVILALLEALGGRGPRPETQLSRVERILIARLDDPVVAIRAQASASLGLLGAHLANEQASLQQPTERHLSSEAVTMLGGRLDDEDGAIRVAAARALGVIGPSSTNVQTQLLRALRHADLATRVAACDALGQVAVPTDALLPVLIEMGRASHTDLVEASCRALKSITQRDPGAVIAALVQAPSLVASKVLEALSIAVPIDESFFKPPAENARGSIYVSPDEEPSELLVLLRADPAIAPEVCRAIAPLLALPDLRWYPVPGSLRQESYSFLEVPLPEMFATLVSFATDVIEGDTSPGVKAWAEAIRGTLVAAGTSLKRGSTLHLT